MMRTYELVVVVRPEFPSDDEEKRQKLVENLAGTEGASVASMAMLGRKRLAYTIKKYHEGTYLLATLTGRSLRSSDIEKRARVNDDVIRYLLTVKK